MRENVLNLEKFYASPLGQAARDMASRRLHSLWPDLAGRNVLGFGFCGPYLDSYQAGANRIILAMPGAQGALAHRGKRGIISCLVEEDGLPFADSTFDTILCVHGVEEAPNLNHLMSELWRVCRPEGHIVIIASNRAGLWARSDRSPFGAGRPFTRSQMRAAMRAVGFHPTIWSGALYAPPLKMFSKGGFLRVSERFGEMVTPGLSGLILVEAIKRLYVDPDRGEKAKSVVARPRFGTSPIANYSPPSHR
ncbi:class I SAM-dependent methyltransferase [Litorimonas haliclonae]|uniref:class I SAM-dependent methyltransferase n=1 Tax=Litorimonas haliclonae TaxID=2081977 RepID=UPI0039EFDC3B